MPPHRDELEAAQHRIRALEDRVEELEAKKSADVPAPAPATQAERETPGAPVDRVAERVARAKKLVRDAEQADAARADRADPMRTAADLALATHPTSKDLVAPLAGFGVAMVSLFLNAARFASRASPSWTEPHPATVLGLLLAVALQAIAIPRIFHPAPLLRTRSEDGQTYSSGLRLSPPTWAAVALVGLVVNVLVHILRS